jgi:protein-disulfide isomerase
MGHRSLAPILAGLSVGIMLAAAGHVVAGEPKHSVSREDLVRAVERGPGPDRGVEVAPVVMVAFSDFQCSYCRQFWQEIFPQIEEQYIRTGKVRLVHRHLAILGEASVQAARAASCAYAQGKFWEYHDALFRNTSPLAFTSARLKRYARELGLEEKPFGACLDGNMYAKRVEAETILGRALGANGTPAFLLNGQLLIGAYPFPTFQRALDGLLASQPQGPSRQSK